MEKFICSTFFLIGCLSIAACRTEEAHGVLVGRFSDQDTLLKAKITLPTTVGIFPLRFELRHGTLSCFLTATFPEKAPQAMNECAGRSSSGEISCNDGRALPLNWSLTSCYGGFGQSSNPGRSTFSFGFGANPDQALDQLEEAGNDG